MLKKICPVCGEIFHTTVNAQKYCSKECGDKSKSPKKTPTRTLICKCCGEKFLSKRRKAYCSEECRMYANGRGRSIYHKKEASKPSYTLAQIAAMANAEGMTYGRYVQKYSL